MFKKKELQRIKTLGERLKKIREDAGTSIAEASKQTQIRQEYIIAIEQGDYSVLPGAVYIESFLKKYAEFLEVNSDFVLSLYHQQDKKSLRKRHQLEKELPKSSINNEIISPKMVRRAIVVTVILACLVYIGLEVSNIFSPPTLAVDSPRDYITVDNNFVVVSGSTEPEALLRINGKETYLDPDGKFNETIILKNDWNEIVISSAKDKSKETIIKRHILFKNED